MSKKKVSKALPRPVKCWAIMSPRGHVVRSCVYQTRRTAKAELGSLARFGYCVGQVSVTPIEPKKRKTKGGKGG